MPAVRRIERPSPVLLACLAMCVVIGVAAGVSPKYGLLGALGLMFAVVAVMDLTFAFLVFVVVSFFDEISSTGSFSGSKLLGLVLVGSLLARLGTQRPGERRSFVGENPALVASLVALLAWAALSATWASSPSTAVAGAERYALNLTLFPIAYAAIRRPRHAVWVVGAYVAGALISGAYGFVHPAAAGSMDAGRLVGANGDANGEATVLAAGIPMLVGLIGLHRGSFRMKLAGMAGVALMFVALAETLSREGLLSLGAVLVVAVLFGGRWRRQAAVLLDIGATAAVGYYAVLAPATALQRVTSGDTSGRSTLWKVAWRVFEAHPVLGVGQDNFILVSHEYINQPGTVQALFVVTTPKVTHNMFLEQLADVGIPGLLTILVAIGLCMRAMVRATRVFERLDDRRMELLCRAVLLGTVAVLTSEFFVSSNYAKYLWIALALGPVLLRLAHQAEGLAEGEGVAQGLGTAEGLGAADGLGTAADGLGTAERGSGAAGHHAVAT